MTYTFGSQSGSRFVALSILGAVLLACVLFFRGAVSAENTRVEGAYDIAGEWEFHNGAIQGDPLRVAFADKVIVPDPLPAAIAQRLAPEFWYRTKFEVPLDLRREGVSLYLGSIKGEHEVYWNGKFLGAGGGTSIGIYRIPSHYLKDSSATITVRVKKIASIFPGIVNMDRIVVGDSSRGLAALNQYYFDTGVKPLLPAVLKLALFFLFVGFFMSVPYKREYLSFALFALFSALSSAFYSRFLPGYENYFFRNSVIFTFSTLAMAVVPMMSADVWRLKDENRSIVRALGFSFSLVFFLAALMGRTPDQQLNIYRMANAVLPWLVLLPAASGGIYFSHKLDTHLPHRKIQIALFSLFLFLGAFAFSSVSASFLQFKLFEFWNFLDLVVLAGLGFSLALDFRFTDQRSQRAAKVIPKWFSGFLSRGIDRITLELPLIVLAVDTVGYTKQLASLPAEDREKLHANIREKLALLMEKGGAQKISERGDGGIFAWDFPDDPTKRREALRAAVGAARFLLGNVGEDPALANFRMGIASGNVRAALSNGDVSFLGEALNVASRLESMAEPGVALVDVALVSLISPEELAEQWIKAELKGVSYQARPLKKAA